MVSVSLFVICLSAGLGLRIGLDIGSVRNMEGLCVAFFKPGVNFASPNDPGSSMYSVSIRRDRPKGVSCLVVAELVVGASLFIICGVAGSGLGIRPSVGSVWIMERLCVVAINASINFVSLNGLSSLTTSARNWCGGLTGASCLGAAELVFGIIPMINVSCFAVS